MALSNYELMGYNDWNGQRDADMYWGIKQRHLAEEAMMIERQNQAMKQSFGQNIQKPIPKKDDPMAFLSNTKLLLTGETQ